MGFCAFGRRGELYKLLKPDTGDEWLVGSRFSKKEVEDAMLE